LLVMLMCSRSTWASHPPLVRRVRTHQAKRLLGYGGGGILWSAAIRSADVRHSGSDRLAPCVRHDDSGSRGVRLCQAKNAADRAGPTFAIGALGEMILLASNIQFRERCSGRNRAADQREHRDSDFQPTHPGSRRCIASARMPWVRSRASLADA
jgi:hypothetical protein